MILVNADYITGKELEMLGLVGGELKAYTEMMNEARAITAKRMVTEAEQLGAEVIAYGTAVKQFQDLSPVPAGRGALCPAGYSPPFTDLAKKLKNFQFLIFLLKNVIIK